MNYSLLSGVELSNACVGRLVLQGVKQFCGLCVSQKLENKENILVKNF